MMQSVENIVCQVFDVTPDNLRSRTRVRKVAEARFFLFWYRYDVEKVRPGSKVTEPFNMDKCMVHHARRRHQEFHEFDKYYRLRADKVLELIEKIDKRFLYEDDYCI
jgi:hypothetical protein